MQPLRVHELTFKSSLLQNGSHFHFHSFLPSLPPHARLFCLSLHFLFDLLVKARQHHSTNCEHLHCCRCEGKHLNEWVKKLLIYSMKSVMSRKSSLHTFCFTLEKGGRLSFQSCTVCVFSKLCPLLKSAIFLLWSRPGWVFTHVHSENMETLRCLQRYQQDTQYAGYGTFECFLCLTFKLGSYEILFSKTPH